MGGICIYARVSTGRQELEQQLGTCRRFCEFKQFRIAHEFSEIGSGKTFKREQLQEMLRRVRAREFEAIVCFRFDRLGRNAREVAMLFDEMEAKGIPIFSVNENLDVTTALGRAMRDIILRLAQLERENIAEATKQRLAALKEAGKHIGRPKGSTDKRPRRKSGYHLRWARKKRGVESAGISSEESGPR